MRTIFFLLVTLISYSSQAGKFELSPFETDYCTNYREGTSANPTQWKHCCLIHDLYFWAGGNKQDRYNADRELKSCIEETGAHRVALLMYSAVRVGSYSPIKYPKRKWNNGWQNRGPFQTLTLNDVEKIETELLGDYDFISNDIRNFFINSLRSRLD